MVLQVLRTPGRVLAVLMVRLHLVRLADQAL
jgi:hypothetical protein